MYNVTQLQSGKLVTFLAYFQAMGEGSLTEVWVLLPSIQGGTGKSSSKHGRWLPHSCIKWQDSLTTASSVNILFAPHRRPCATRVN